jgi:hypothetical protein
MKNRNVYIPGRNVDKRDVEVCSFIVRGSGRFPFDMLRRDRCWPAGEHESYRLTVDDDELALRQVKLHGLAYPTIERWRSFGWIVQEIEGVEGRA